MDVKLSCHACGQHMVVDASAGGSRIDCPSCGILLIIPMVLGSDRTAPSSPVAQSVTTLARKPSGIGWAILGGATVLIGALILAAVGYNTPNIDEWWQERSRSIADEKERFEMSWEIERSKELLQIFKGNDGSKLPYKQFIKLWDSLSENPIEANPRDDIITETYANYINWFTQRNDVPVEEALRYDYILTSHGLNLIQYDTMIFRVHLARMRAIGLPLSYELPKKHFPRKLVSGEPKPKQNPEMSQEEQTFVKSCKHVVKEVWKE